MEELDRRIQEIKEQKEKRERGELNLIPFYYHFPRLSKIIPGLFKQGIYKILSPTGVGKSKLARYLSIIVPYEVSKKLHLNFHTLFFALEESKEEFIDSMIIMMLKIHHNIDIDRLSLNSYFENPLKEDVLAKIIDVKQYVEDLLQHVTIYDDIKNPTGIYKACKDFSEQHGTHIYKHVVIDNEKRTVHDRYVAKDDMFVTVVVDHISLLDEERSSIKNKTLDKRETMSLWNDDYCSIIANKWNWICLNVQQVAMNTDDANHQKLGKLEPELSDAGDNKMVLRTDKVVFALFDPQRHGIKQYLGYNMQDFKDSFRPLKVLKNRYGLANRILPMLFEGASGRFTELTK